MRDIWKTSKSAVTNQKPMVSGSRTLSPTANAKQQPAPNSGTAPMALPQAKTTPPPAAGASTGSTRAAPPAPSPLTRASQAQLTLHSPAPAPQPTVTNSDGASMSAMGQGAYQMEMQARQAAIDENRRRAAAANTAPTNLIIPEPDPVTVSEEITPIGSYEPINLTLDGNTSGAIGTPGSAIEGNAATNDPGAMGYNDFYSSLVEADMDAAATDRDVIRAATLREAREAAIAQGIQPGTRGYQRMMEDANATANVHALQSRNDAATRAQELMLQQRGEDERNQDRLLEFLDNTQQREFWKTLKETDDPNLAMDAALATEAPSAMEAAILEEAKDLVALDPVTYPTVESAMDAARSTIKESKELQNQELTTAADRADMVPFIEEQISMGNTGGVGWDGEMYAAAYDNGYGDQLSLNTTLQTVDFSKVKPHQLDAVGIREGENVLIGSTIYRITGPITSQSYERGFGESDWHGVDDIPLKPLYNINDGTVGGPDTTATQAKKAS